MSSLLTIAGLLTRFLYDVTNATVLLFVSRLLPAIHIKPVDLTGQNIIVTGANSGIGLSIATSLAHQNATVYLACRSISKGQDAARQITGSQEDMQQRVHVMELDTSSLESVRAFANAWTKKPQGAGTRPAKIDVLIHNAGISGPPPGQDVTKEGLGMIYATNFLGSFLLTSLLESSLTDNARVIFTSSTGQYGGKLWSIISNPGLLPQMENGKKPNDSGFYATTKSMQVLFAKLLQRRWNKKSSSKAGRVAHAFTPGYTYTPIFGKMKTMSAAFDPVFWILKTATFLSTPVDVGATTGTWLATTQDAEVTDPHRGGAYWERCVRRLARVDAEEAIYGIGELEKLWPLFCRDSGAQWE